MDHPGGRALLASRPNLRQGELQMSPELPEGGYIGFKDLGFRDLGNKGLGI